ncbi:hypothetical protein [Rhodococcus sp. NPDC049939]|uniref:hypothetical protein n=1 Tax=Rhodococcus sp. NPDC049939 TaxID=3155511 RepID=UPI0033DBD245
MTETIGYKRYIRQIDTNYAGRADHLFRHNPELYARMREENPDWDGVYWHLGHDLTLEPVNVAEYVPNNITLE